MTREIEREGHCPERAAERRPITSVRAGIRPGSNTKIEPRASVIIRRIRVVSALLGRRVDRGAVLVDGTGRKRWYAAAERLYSIYYKLRRERDDAAIVHYLIQFMTTFYSDDELAALAMSDRGEARLGISAVPDLQLEVAKVLVIKGLTHGQRGESEEELAAYDAVVERFGASDAPELQVQVAKALVIKGHHARPARRVRGGAGSLRRGGRAFRRLVPNVRFWTRRLAWATRPSALMHADERENQSAGAGRGRLGLGRGRVGFGDRGVDLADPAGEVSGRLRLDVVRTDDVGLAGKRRVRVPLVVAGCLLDQTGRDSRGR